MKFRSRIQWGLFLPIIAVLIGLGIALVFTGTWFVLVVNTLAALLILHLITATDYTIEEDRLIVRSGLLYKSTIRLSEIRKIRPTTSVLSAPAASIKGRLEVSYGKGAQIIISPADIEGFMATVVARNPDIVV